MIILLSTKKEFKLSMTCLTNVKNAEMFKRMKEVGFSIISFGVESDNNDILRIQNFIIMDEDCDLTFGFLQFANIPNLR